MPLRHMLSRCPCKSFMKFIVGMFYFLLRQKYWSPNRRPVFLSEVACKGTIALAVEFSKRFITRKARVISSYSPVVAGTRNVRNSTKDIVRRSNIWTVDDTPACAIPMFDQCLVYAAAVNIGSYRPDIVCRDHCHGCKVVAACSNIRTVDNAPTCPIIVFDQCFIAGISYYPDILGGESCYAVKSRIWPTGRWSNHPPLCAVPVFNLGYCSSHATIDGSNSPDILR